MSHPSLISHRDFETLIKEAEFMQHVLTQILKEFQLSGIDASVLSVEVDPGEFIIKLVSLIDELLQNQSQKLQLLLYQSDIPENVIEEEQLAEEQANLSEVIAQLLLKRTMLKVVTRMRYS